MLSLRFLDKFQASIAGLLRNFEYNRAFGDEAKTQEIAGISDQELLVKWLWVLAIVCGPIWFLAVPFLLSMFGHMMSKPLRAFFWMITDVSMIGVFLTFLLALYFTTRQRDY